MKGAGAQRREPREELEMDAVIEHEIAETEARIRALQPCSDAAQWMAWAECNVRIALGAALRGDMRNALCAALTAQHCVDCGIRAGYAAPALCD